jgi:hypothetical protein
MNTNNKICYSDFRKNPLFISKNNMADITMKIDDNVNNFDEIVNEVCDNMHNIEESEQNTTNEYNPDNIEDGTCEEENNPDNDEDDTCEEEDNPDNVEDDTCEEDNNDTEDGTYEEEDNPDAEEDTCEDEDLNKCPYLCKRRINISGCSFDFTDGVSGKCSTHIPEYIRIEHSFDNCVIMAIASLVVNCVLVTVMWNIG